VVIPKTGNHETPLATAVRQKPRGYADDVSSIPNSKTKKVPEASLGTITFHNS